MTLLPINIDNLRTLIAAGEDSTLQFKADITNADGLAAEMAAMANGKGGRILLGVADNDDFMGHQGHLSGLDDSINDL